MTVIPYREVIEAEYEKEPVQYNNINITDKNIKASQ